MTPSTPPSQDRPPDRPDARARIERLAERIDALGAPICVGLDPVFERLPEDVRADAASPTEAIERFSLGVIDAAAGVAPAVKLQSACFERYGSPGVGVLERVAARAADVGLWTILDAKRGDIGISAAHYAAAAAALGVDAITASPYLGVDVLSPLLESGLVVFALVRTSNPEGDAIQRAPLAGGDGAGRERAHTGGTSVAELVAGEVSRLGQEWMGYSGLSALGAVVGATHPDEGRGLRARMPNQPILIPGYGAQGGGIEGVRALRRDADAGPGGVLVSASRSVIYPSEPGAPGDGWSRAIGNAARAFAEEMARL